jgi:hypothetical protein
MVPKSGKCKHIFSEIINCFLIEHFDGALLHKKNAMNVTVFLALYVKKYFCSIEIMGFSF